MIYLTGNLVTGDNDDGIKQDGASILKKQKRTYDVLGLDQEKAGRLNNLWQLIRYPVRTITTSLVTSTALHHPSSFTIWLGRTSIETERQTKTSHRRSTPSHLPYILPRQQPHTHTPPLRWHVFAGANAFEEEHHRVEKHHHRVEEENHRVEEEHHRVG